MDHLIPQYLDEPARFLIFTIDEGLAILVPLLTGLLLANFFIGLVLGFVCFATLRKMKQGGSLYMLLWKLYWILPTEVMRLKKMPRSDQRVLVG